MYQLNIADLHKVLISNVNKLMPNIFDKENYKLHYENLKLFLKIRLKLKKCVAL